MNITGLWDQLVQCICRPPRDDNYNIDELPGGPRSNVACVRKDIKLENKRNQRLECSHCFSPSSWRQHERDSSARIPCVVYCHCNSGSRRDAEEATMYLLSKGISVFCLDFAGSGRSQGEYVTLGAHEVDDLEAAVAHLRQDGITGTVGLWGRSMGAVTALLFSQRDPSIAGIVLDSPFSKLTDLMLELVEEQRLPIPRALYKMALGMMRRSVKKRAHFNIDTVSPIDVVQESFIPALFGHGREDTFIGIHHSQKLHDKYGGEKQLITFPGDHNSMRQDHFYRRVQRFFKAVLIDSPAGRPCKAFAHVKIADSRQLKQDGKASQQQPGWDEDERDYVSEESYTSRASDQTNESTHGLGRVASRPGSFRQDEYDVALAAAIEASLADTSPAGDHAEGGERQTGTGHTAHSSDRAATHVVSGATTSSLHHIIPSNIQDMDPEDAEEAMLAQAITASLIESEPDLKAARQSEIEAAGSAQPLHSPEQPVGASSPPSSTSQTLPIPKWTSADLGITPASTSQVSTPAPGGSSPSQPHPICSTVWTGSSSSRPGSASCRSAMGASPRLSQVSPRLDLMEEPSGEGHLSRSPFAGLAEFADSPSHAVEIPRRDGGMQQARPSGAVMSSMSGDIKLPSTAGQTPVDSWLDSSGRESSGAAAGSSSHREMPTGLEANFSRSLPESSWPDHDHAHAMAMLKRTSSGASGSSVSSGAEWQTAQHSSQPNPSTEMPTSQPGVGAHAATGSNPSPQAPRSGAGNASTFSSRHTQSPKTSEKDPDLLPLSTRGQQ
ncbi:hypothetical protein WJX74_006286 [Apatococcus lobatus]|uniref:Serine aminopeptidase S33 domain-containing protein n=1 Tax=Apatococcus lobatus TaxID=904363 RepID=A0AAW1RU37_9CHLO